MNSFPATLESKAQEILQKRGQNDCTNQKIKSFDMRLCFPIISESIPANFHQHEQPNAS